ncbi:MAG: flap endonuclease-1 [Candidatus Nanoarchaeia archaeon]|jgi:flap endonuclease-1|nr:flap endonuclease-1 [Candidatus Nanoarchaeia archaeon]|tara:strand:+ start:1581 stop:2582 length:1002 start_codon:yes stop_codon:yes gene_type:complete
MGIPLRDIVSKQEITIEELHGKRLAFDGYNVLYQFLSAIRGPDGTPLKNSDGKITSHLLGLLARTTKLMEQGVKPVFVFDGKAPDLKLETIEKRKAIKLAAAEKLKKATEDGDTELMKKYAQQTSRLTADMVSESREMLHAMGVPTVQALGDGEAQAAFMAIKGDVWGVASQDYDSLLFGAPRLIRNLTISQRRRVAGTRSTIVVRPEIVDLTETLTNLEIDRGKLIDAAILIGTDFNQGVRGIGPKTSMKIVREDNFNEHKEKVPRYQQVRDIFLNSPQVSDYSLKWPGVNKEKLRELLTANRFSEQRIDKAIKALQKAHKQFSQSGLGEFL